MSAKSGVDSCPVFGLYRVVRQTGCKKLVTDTIQTTILHPATNHVDCGSVASCIIVLICCGYIDMNLVFAKMMDITKLSIQI